MSKKPYIIQEDSPNLIIVPVSTEIGDEPVPKKTKLDNNSLNKLLVQNNENSTLLKANKKVKPPASCRDDSVLIDVRKFKKQPSSWAANFLQSIGGSSSKTSRSYHNLATKLSTTRPENTRPNATEISTQLKSTPNPAVPVSKEPTLLKFNKASQPIVKEVNQTKPNKEAALPKANQESLQLKVNKELPQLKVDRDILQRKVSKEAALPQSYRQTTHSKTNKEGLQPKPNKANQSKNIYVNKEATQLKAKKPALLIKPNKEYSQSKVYKVLKQKSKKEETQTVLELYNYYTEITSQKTYQTASETRAIKEDTRPKSYREPTQTNINKETVQPKAKKSIQPNLSTESSKPKHNKGTQPKAYKEASQLKATKASSQQIGHKKASKDITHKETTKRKKSKESAQISHVKPSTAALKKVDIPLSKKSFKVSDNNKNPAKPSTNNKIKSENSKPLYQEKTKGISPIKSVVTKIMKNNNMQNKEKQFHTECDHHFQHSESDADLRAKLKRKVARNDMNINEEENRSIINIKKFCSMSNRKSFVPNENLIISFNAESDTEKVLENKPLAKTTSQKQSSKGKKFKKIKLTINLIVQNTDTTDEDSDNIESCNENTDLSFLDDFNIDEIVNSLNDCRNTAKTGTEISLNNNTVINKNDSMDPGLLTNNGKEVMYTNDGKKAKHSTPKEKILTENNSPNAGKDIKQNQHSAVTKYLEDKKSVLQLTNKENSPGHQNRADESDASNLGDINVKNILTNDKEDHNINSLVKMSIKRSDGYQNFIENTTNISNYVELSNEQKNSAADHIHIDDNSVGLQPKINVCSNNDITCTDMLPKEVKSLKLPTELSADNELINTAKCSRCLPDSKNMQPTNSYHDKHVNHNTEEKLTTQSNDVKTNDASNDQVSKCNESPTKDKELSSNVEINKDNGEVISIEDDDYKIVEVKEQQHLIQKSIVDLTRSVDGSSVIPLQSIVDLTRSVDGSRVTTFIDKEKNTVENMIPNTIESNTKTILIVETDNDVGIESESKSDPKEVKNGSNVTHNNIVKTRGPTKSIEKVSNDVKYNNDSQNKLENSKVKATIAGDQTRLAKDKNDNVNKSAKPVDNKIVVNKELPTAKQNQAKTKTPESKDGKPKTEAVKPTNANAKKQPTMPKQQNNDKVLESNDTKLSFVDKRLANDVLARNLEKGLQKYKRNSYSVTKFIHKGRFSTVYCCQDGNGCTNAVKVLKEPCDYLNVGKAKEDMLIKLQNGVPEDNLNIVRFSEGFSLTGHWCFVMEYYPRNLLETLATNKRSFHIDAVQNLSRQLVAAVTILRNNNIIHSDIKPRHILLNEAQTRLKLCGFDEAFYFRNNRLLPNVGTPSYRAPELILGYNTDYGIDVWATATVIYEMATKRILFPGQYNNEILYQQLCILEDVPYDMLQKSMYKNKHYIGDAFGRIVGYNGQERVIIYKFIRKNWITNSLLDTYDKEWAAQTPALKRLEDRQNIAALSKLLYQMLVMHPRYRIAIEFVFANPFIYELFED